MDELTKHRKLRLRQLIDGPKFRGSQADLAAASGLSEGRISQLLDPDQAFGERAAAGLVDKLGLEEKRYFEFGYDDGTERLSIVSMPQGAYSVRNIHEVPVIGQGEGGLPERIWGDGDHPVGMSDEFTEAATTDPQAFVIRVHGDSMVPRYMPGEYALVEPNTSPEIEDDVLVRLKNDGTMLKRLLSRRGGWRFGSYNDNVVHAYKDDDVVWVYYVAHPIPARKIKQRT